MKALLNILIAFASHAQCITVVFTYPAGELTNVASFTIEKSTNVFFTNAQEIVTIVATNCDTNGQAFYRVRANPKP